jgi:hypothetical protein
VNRPKPQIRRAFHGLSQVHSPRAYDGKGLSQRTSAIVNFLERGKERVARVDRTHTLEKEGTMINYIGFHQGAKESIRIRCLNNPRLGGRAAPEGRVCTKWCQSLNLFLGRRRQSTYIE